MFIIRRWPVPLSVKIRSSSRYLNNFNTADTTNLLSINVIVAEEKTKKLMISSTAIAARYSLPQRTNNGRVNVKLKGR